MLAHDNHIAASHSEHRATADFIHHLSESQK